ncbi:Aldo/keto reductase family-domain-containing protein [Dichotomopilus funicola]|uniref:Aldo/keto reductase family-domain-containing protein n=1 Tax=Dichotomopilus funicola TaxID=1934379 RepID=A0AAN6V782_9PEZI|nr:Aldo/keto reductase family-domain-containing protein [Dichotomopilus funicola]
MADPTTDAGTAGSLPRPPLHTVLPPLVFGTATFNTQYVADPHSMPYRDIVARALALGVNAFDTSPYYGPSEILLGTALDALVRPPPPAVPIPRSSFFLVTKAGRIGITEFDYSPAWVRYSVLRSLRRLHTSYLDLVYLHDVEFVTPTEVVAAVRELRRLRDEEDGIVRYVGISGFPVDVLCQLAELVLAETGEPVDAVMSYGHFTVQNRVLGLPWAEAAPGSDETLQRADSAGTDTTAAPLARFKAAGVDVVLNASMLGMGLLTSEGIPTDDEPTPSNSGPDSRPSSPLSSWHPSPPELRVTCRRLADIAATAGERLESVSMRWSMAEWARIAAAAGLGVDYVTPGAGPGRLGVTVCGVKTIGELEDTVAEWRGVLATLGQQLAGGQVSVAEEKEEPYGAARQEKILNLVRNELWPELRSWLDYAWDSPGPGFVNTKAEEDRGVVPDDGIIAEYELAKNSIRADRPAR